MTTDDFEAAAVQLPGVTLPAGTTGTFSIGVTSEVNAALDRGDGFFSLQGRVDAGSPDGSGTQVRTAPDLDLTPAPKAPPPVEYALTSVPSSGTLTDSQGTVIDATNCCASPFVLPDSTLSFTPESSGTVSVGYQATDTTTLVVDTGVVTVNTLDFVDPCEAVGRPPGCSVSSVTGSLNAGSVLGRCPDAAEPAGVTAFFKLLISISVLSGHAHRFR